MKRMSYERQDEETKKAFEAFTIYRDLGPERSIRKVSERLRKSEALLYRWSAQYEWVDRAKDYDAEMDRLALLQEVKDRKAMNKRQAGQAKILQGKALEALKNIKPEELDIKDIIKMFVEGAKVERLARGESTENAEVKHSGEVKERIEHDITERVEKYANIYEKLSEEEKDSQDESNHEGNDT